MHQRLSAWFAIIVLGLFANRKGFAQGLTVEIANGNASAIPVVTVPFAYEGTGAPPETDVADVIRGDLNRCGQFRTLPKSDIVEYPTRGNEIKFPTWRLLKQDYISVGRISDAGAGEVRVEFELYTVGDQKPLVTHR